MPWSNKGGRTSESLSSRIMVKGMDKVLVMKGGSSIAFDCGTVVQASRFSILLCRLGLIITYYCIRDGGLRGDKVLGWPVCLK